jgi:uncharacterized protein (TIGR02118 family)
MIRATIAYRADTGTRFDLDYYVTRHTPFARQLLSETGLVRLEVDRGVSGEERGSRAPYACATHLYFESAEDFYAAMAAHGDALGDDVPNYTDMALEIQVSEIVL